MLGLLVLLGLLILILLLIGLFLRSFLLLLVLRDLRLVWLSEEIREET